MRTQSCRDAIHKTAEKCGLSPKTVEEIDRVAGFVNEHPHLCGLSTDAVKPLMKISDPEKQQEAISHVEKSLNRKTPTGGTYKKRITKPEVEKIVEKVAPETLAPQSLAEKMKDPQPPAILTDEQKRKQNRDKLIEAAQAFICLIPISKQNAITRYCQDAHVETDADFLIQAIDLALEVMK